MVVLLMLGACGAAGKDAEPNSGIEGTVTIGPTCPVERADSPCPDKPVAAQIRVLRVGSGDLYKRGSSGEDGRFKIALEPGRYIVSAESSLGGPGGASPASVTVSPGRFTRVDLVIDSGIR